MPANYDRLAGLLGIGELGHGGGGGGGHGHGGRGWGGGGGVFYGGPGYWYADPLFVAEDVATVIPVGVPVQPVVPTDKNKSVQGFW
jgi:hypothetical protein